MMRNSWRNYYLNQKPLLILQPAHPPASQRAQRLLIFHPLQRADRLLILRPTERAHCLLILQRALCLFARQRRQRAQCPFIHQRALCSFPRLPLRAQRREPALATHRPSMSPAPLLEHRQSS